MSDAACCQLTLKLSVVTSLLLTLTGDGARSTRTQKHCCWCSGEIWTQCASCVVMLTSCEAICKGIGLALIVDGGDAHGVLGQRVKVT